MWDWIVQYWVQVFFGLIIAGFSVMARQLHIMYKHERARFKEEDIHKCYEKVRKDIEDLEAKILEHEKSLDSKIDTINKQFSGVDPKLKDLVQDILKRMDNFEKNVLIIEGAYFCERCQRLLDRDGLITSEEFKDLSTDHKAYNDAGGNHTGDALFKLVEQKFNAQHAK